MEAVGRPVQVSPTPILGTWIFMQFFITETVQASPSGRTLSCLSYLPTVLLFVLTSFQAQLPRHLVLHTNFIQSSFLGQAVPDLAASIVISALLHGSKFNLTQWDADNFWIGDGQPLPSDT